MRNKLKLLAEDEADLKILSASLQDAIGRVGEMKYDAKGRAFTLRLSRYVREQDTPARILTGLRIDSVLGIKARGIDQSDPSALAVLLSIEFAKGAVAPSGALTLIFAGGGEINLDVECIDMRLADVSDLRPTDKKPLHPVEIE